jgi:hypothetical protein
MILLFNTLLLSNILKFILDYRLYITWIMHQQFWGYKVEDKLHLGIKGKSYPCAQLTKHYAMKTCEVVDV